MAEFAIIWSKRILDEQRHMKNAVKQFMSV